MFRRAVSCIVSSFPRKSAQPGKVSDNFPLFFEEALAIRSQALGDSHPKTITTRTAYAALLHRLGRPEGAGNFER
jgi:hypothetical protein